MSEQSDSLGITVLAALCGIVAVGAALAGFNTLAVTGGVGFALIVLWLVITGPQVRGRSDSTGYGLWGDTSGQDGGDGGGGAG